MFLARNADDGVAVTQTEFAGRYRSDGIDQRSIDSTGLCFDPLQGGWVSETVIDDLATYQRPTREMCPALAFRPWTKTDANRYAELLNDPLIWEHMPEEFPEQMTEATAAALIEIANTSQTQDVLAILHHGQPVGQVRIDFVHSHHTPSEAEISYWVGQPYWRRGIASRAISAFLKQCFEKHGKLSSLLARVKRGNTGSLRVLQKAGFASAGSDASGWTLWRKHRGNRKLPRTAPA